MKSVILIILYKETISSSRTVSSLMNNCKTKIEDVIVFLWDNSPEIMDQKHFEILDENKIKYEYRHTPENLALSKIYNKVIDIYKVQNYDFLFLFDQDSDITSEYFESVKNACIQNPDVNLFVPYIVTENKIVSPGDLGLYTGRYWSERKIGKIRAKNRIAIASGMLIRFDCFIKQNLVFDENLLFYGIDTKFCLDYSLKNKWIYVIDYQLSHSLSIFEEESNVVKLRRLRSHGSSLRYILRKNILGYLIASVSYTFKWIKLKILIFRDERNNK